MSLALEWETWQSETIMNNEIDLDEIQRLKETRRVPINGKDAYAGPKEMLILIAMFVAAGAVAVLIAKFSGLHLN